MVKLGPDLENGRDSYSGFQPDGEFTGFSMLHEHGTGGAPKYGVVSQMPVVGDISNPMLGVTATRKHDDVTEVGYYKASLGSGVVVELGATDRAGMFKYRFPKDGTDAQIVVDVSHVLPSYRGQGLGQNYLGGSITVEQDDNMKTRYTGHGTYDNVSPVLPMCFEDKVDEISRAGTGQHPGASISVVTLIARRLGRRFSAKTASQTRS